MSFLIVDVRSRSYRLKSGFCRLDFFILKKLCFANSKLCCTFEP